MDQLHNRIYALVYNICGSHLGSILCDNYNVDDLTVFLTTYHDNITKKWLNKMEVDEIFMQNDSDDLEELNLTLTESDIVASGMVNNSFVYNSSLDSANDMSNVSSDNTFKKRKVYTCRECNKSYCNVDGVRKHWRKKHYTISIRRGCIQDYCKIIAV